LSGLIFVLGDDGELRELREAPYEAEDVLQRLIARYPNLIPGDQIDPAAPRRWLLISREQGVPSEEQGGARWSLDHLFLDQDAIPTLVEVKRSSDTRLRREVVGQMLDYAANAVVYWPIEQLRASFVRTCEEEEMDAGEVLGVFLRGQDDEDFWRRVKTNLQAGRVRMVFLADVVPPELTRIVEFLNEQMDPAEVIAVEVPRFAGEGLQTLTPRVVGLTQGARRRKSSGERITRNWDRDSFLDQLEANCGANSRAITEAIMAWASDHLPRQWFGTGTTNASFVPTRDHGDSSIWPFGLYLSGHVEIKFQYIASWPPFDDRDRRAEILHRLNSIDGIDLPEDRLEKRPSFRVEVLESHEALQSFLDTMAWVVDEVASV
jgi:hypothetical protein